MSNELNESGPSRPKRICTNRGYESRIEQMLFESESDDDFDFSDSGSDYMAEAFYLYIYTMTPNGVKQRLAKKLFNDADDAKRRHKKKTRKFYQHRGMGIQKSSRSERVKFIWKQENNKLFVDIYQQKAEKIILRHIWSVN